MKYKRIISIILILIILFNVFTINVYADPWWDNKVIRWAFVVFASTLNAYNVVASVVNAKALFENWWYGLDAYDREDYYNNTKSLFNMGVLDTAMIGYGINEWIKEKFRKGFNSIILPNPEVVYYGDINYNETVIMQIPNNSSIIGNTYVFSAYGYSGSVTIDDWTNNKYYYTRNYAGKIKSHFTSGSTSNYLQFRIQKSGDIIRIGQSYNSWINHEFFPYTGNVEYDIISDFSVSISSYAAGEAVDYPMDEYPEDKPVILPAPNFDNPNLGYDDAGNKVFDGTVEEFLDGALDNNEYYDKLIDNILDGSLSGAGSTTNVNTNDGTITWPISETWPVTGSITYPDLTYPNEVSEAVNEQTGVITGIADFISNIFAEPTKTIDLNLLQVDSIKEKFPFCLPFDLVNLFTDLSDSGEAPEIEFKFEIFNQDYTIDLDFNQFEEIAKITRWFTLISFIIGLILITRNIIGAGA